MLAKGDRRTWVSREERLLRFCVRCRRISWRLLRKKFNLADRSVGRGIIEFRERRPASNSPEPRRRGRGIVGRKTFAEMERDVDLENCKSVETITDL